MKKYIVLIVLAFSFGFTGISSVVYASTQTINVSYDNELNSRQPDTVKSTSSYIDIGHRSTYGNETMYYVGKLDLGSVDKTKNIQKAVIKIDRVSSSLDNDSMKYNLDRLVSGWDSSTATWNNAPIIGADPPVQGVKGDYGIFEFNVTDLVKGWVNGGPNFLNDGFRISKAGGANLIGNIYASFASSDYPANGLETRPYLEITYSETPIASTEIRITSFSPTFGLPGSKVFIYGDNLNKVTNVVFSSVGTGGDVVVGFSRRLNASTGKTFLEASLPSSVIPGNTYIIKVAPWGDPPNYSLAPGKFTVTSSRPTVTSSSKATISFFSPTSGLPRTGVTIYGANFGEIKNVVLYKTSGLGKNIEYRPFIKFVSDTQITFVLPSNIPAGRYTVKVAPWGDPPNYSSAPGKFTVTSSKPTVTSSSKATISFFSPTSGLPRTGVTIYGANFGEIKNVVLYKTSGLGKNIEYRPFIKFVSDTQITFVLPSNIPAGRYTVKVAPWGDPPNYSSAPGRFTVTSSRPTVTPAPTYQPGASSKPTPIVAPPVFVAPTPMMFTRNIWRGMRGNDVKKLQQLFNSNPDLRIAESGLGSPGNETNYYGFLTMLAVQNFQCKYKIVCLGSSDGTGYGVVGPQTRIKLQEVFGKTSISPTVSPSGNLTKPDTAKNLRKTINSHPSNGASHGAVKPKTGTKSQKISNKANTPSAVSPSGNSTSPTSVGKLQKTINRMLEKIKELQKQIKSIMNFF